MTCVMVRAYARGPDFQRSRGLCEGLMVFLVMLHA